MFSLSSSDSGAGRHGSCTAPVVNCADGMPRPFGPSVVIVLFHGVGVLVDGEVSLVFAGGPGDDEAERS